MLEVFSHREHSFKRIVAHKKITVGKHVRYDQTMTTNIKSLRLERNMTQQEVYEMAGISKSYYSNLESGKRQLNERLMKALARVFKVEPFELVTNHSDEKELKFISDLSKLDEHQRKLVQDLAASLAKAASQNS